MDPLSFETFQLLGIPVTAVTLPDVVRSTSALAQSDRPHAVFVREVASLMAAVDSPPLRELHFKASLVVPDGMPLVWAGKLKGFGKSVGRVAGADLVDAVCAHSIKTGQSHFFFGGAPGVAETMASRLAAKYPGLRIAGILTPPMRSIGKDFRLEGEALAEVEEIKRAAPDFVWVGISSPKQEFWMAEVMQVLDHAVFFGVGAAFDYHSGRLKRAPRWMRNNGLEWLYRLYTEPRRLWHRYLVLAPKFIALLTLGALGLRTN